MRKGPGVYGTVVQIGAVFDCRADGQTRPHHGTSCAFHADGPRVSVSNVADRAFVSPEACNADCPKSGNWLRRSKPPASLRWTNRPRSWDSPEALFGLYEGVATKLPAFPRQLSIAC